MKVAHTGKVSPLRVEGFRETHGLDQPALAAILGFSPTSEGRAVRRWKAVGAPPHVELIFRYMEKDRLRLAREIGFPLKVPPESVTNERERRGMDQKDFDRLMAHSSKGRACRRWEADGAPAYVALLLAYMGKFGDRLAEEYAKELEGA